MGLCKLFGVSKQAYYQHDESRVLLKAAQESFVLEYVRTIREKDPGDPKDNAQAERINNTMKNELLKGKRFTNIQQVTDAVEKAVDFYNNERPHMSIGMMTPSKAAVYDGVVEKIWTSYREKAIREKRDALKIPENPLPLCIGQGSPSGLRPPVNP